MQYGLPSADLHMYRVIFGWSLRIHGPIRAQSDLTVNFFVCTSGELISRQRALVI